MYTSTITAVSRTIAHAVIDLQYGTNTTQFIMEDK